MMNYFVKNKCRFCRKVFCCPSCSSEHEKRAHVSEINSNFCNYKVLNLSACVSEVQKTRNHKSNICFPTTCSNCGEMLRSAEHLEKHLKTFCTPPSKSEESKKEAKFEFITPLAIKNPKKDNEQNITTSTPMVNDHDKLALKDMQNIIITPVGNVGASKSIKVKQSGFKFSQTSYEIAEITDSSMKRRVTFSDTVHEIDNYDVKNIKIINNNLTNIDVVLQKVSVCECSQTVDDDNALDSSWHTAVAIQEDEPSNQTSFFEFLHESDQSVNASSSRKTSKTSILSEIWSSVSCVASSLLDSFTDNTSNISCKRAKPDEDDTFDGNPLAKRRKFYPIECRKSIHPLPVRYSILKRKQTCDKATQTDEIPLI